MLTIRCIVTGDQCSRRTEATTLSGTLGDVVRAGLVKSPTKGIRIGAGNPKSRRGFRAHRTMGPGCRETAPGINS